MLSRTLYFAGRTAEREAAGEAAVALLEGLAPGHELAIAYGSVAQRRMVVEDADGANAWGARALELAERLDDTEAYVDALTNIGAQELRAGDEEGQRKLQRALALAQQHGLEDHAVRIFNSLVMWPLRLRRFADCERYLSPGLDYCAERGLDTWRLYLMACRSRLERDRGAGPGADEAASSVLRASVARNWALIVLGLVRTRAELPSHQCRADRRAIPALDRG